MLKKTLFYVIAIMGGVVIGFLMTNRMCQSNLDHKNGQIKYYTDKYKVLEQLDNNSKVILELREQRSKSMSGYDTNINRIKDKNKELLDENNFTGFNFITQ